MLCHNRVSLQDNEIVRRITKEASRAPSSTHAMHLSEKDALEMASWDILLDIEMSFKGFSCGFLSCFVLFCSWDKLVIFQCYWNVEILSKSISLDLFCMFFPITCDFSLDIHEFLFCLHFSLFHFFPTSMSIYLYQLVPSFPIFFLKWYIEI